jgi:hypothetical protein
MTATTTAQHADAWRGGSVLPSALGNSLRGWWAERQPYQTFLYGTAAVLIAAGLVHAVLWAATGGSWTGPVSWRKPTLFGISFGLTALSLAWIHTFLRPRPIVGWLICGSFGVAAAGEVALISLQRWRGVASHFNMATRFDAAVFQLMGALVAIAALGVVAVTIRSLGRLATSPSMALAIRAGLLLLVAGQILGGLIIRHGTAMLYTDPGAGLAHASIFGAAGQLKMPHAVALHAVQALPVLAWLLSNTVLTERARRRLVIAATTGYTGLLGVSCLQTFRGLAPLALDAAAFCVLLLSVMLLISAGAVTLISLVRRTGRAPRRSQTR